MKRLPKAVYDDFNGRKISGEQRRKLLGLLRRMPAELWESGVDWSRLAFPFTSVCLRSAAKTESPGEARKRNEAASKALRAAVARLSDPPNGWPGAYGNRDVRIADVWRHAGLEATVGQLARGRAGSWPLSVLLSAAADYLDEVQPAQVTRCSPKDDVSVAMAAVEDFFRSYCGRRNTELAEKVITAVWGERLPAKFDFEKDREARGRQARRKRQSKADIST